MYFRMDVIKKSANEIVNNSTKDGCKYEEIPELESRNQSYDGLCLTDDFMVASISDSTDLNHINSSEVEEESALCLIQRKREGLNHLRLPTTMERIESNSSLSVETLIHSPSFLDDYISAIRPLSVRNKGFSKRTCVHTCAQEGTEKKQAASGSKGTRKKSVQSSTRRRSTRNSKSEVSQLQSSPKSSNSDNDAPGCNSSSTKTLSTEHPSKPPTKRRKRAPKKAPQTRKRLRSATQTPQEADESKGDSNSESEQDEKKLKIPDDLSASTQFEVITPPASTTEKVYQPEDHSSVLSLMDQSTEEHSPASSPMQNMESFVKETSASPELQNEYLFDKENSPPSPIFTNGQTTAEKSQPESMFGSELGSDVVETTKHLITEEGHSLQAENLQVSEGECQGSPLSVKCTDDVYSNKESASSDSENEMEVLEKHSISSVLSEAVPHRMEQDYSDIGQAGVQSSESLNESQSSGSSESKAEHLSDLEDRTEFSEAGEYTSLPAVDTQKQSHLEHSSSSCDSFKENPPEIPDLPKVLTVELPVQDSSFKSDEELGDKQVNGVENVSQEPKLTDSKTSVPGESTHMITTDNSVNRTHLSEQSTAEELCDVGEAQDGLCNDDLQPLVDKTENIPEVSSVVASGKMSDNTNIGKESDFNNEEKVTYSEDNIESVAMECDSVCSDREPEQPTKLTETVVAEPGSLVSTKTEELESTEKQSVPLEERQKKELRPRKSRFHSPSTTWSPTKNEVKERQKSRSRSRSKNRDSPLKRKSRSRSRDRDHSEQWKGRSRDRRHRRQSRSKSRSRSRSGSRTRDRNRSNTAERSEKDSPWRERRSNDNWKSPRGTDRYRRNENEKTNEPFRSDKYDSRDSSEQYPDNKNDHPDWVSEKIQSFDSRGRGDGWIRGDSRGRGWGDNRGRGRGENRGRGDHRGRGDFRGRGDHRGRGDGRGRGGNRGRGSPRGSHWEDNQCDSWNRNVNMEWNSPRGRGGRGRGSFGGGFNYGDQNENSWNDRQPFSGNSNTLGPEPTWVQEHKNYKAKFEETFESPVDRSGWTSASSWAVRKTLPADVQNYYSKRGRTSTGSQQGWTKPEVSQDQDQTIKDQPSQQTESAQMPVNMVQTPMNVVPPPMNAPPPQPVNIYPYSVAVPPPLVSMQHNPYNIHPQLPIHLHPALPIVQVSAPSSVPQGLPPPPPPPPPSQQVGYIAPQPEGERLPANPSVSHVSNHLAAAPPLPTPAVAQGGVVGTAVAPSSASVAASVHSKNPYVSVKPALWKETVTVEASADSSKKEKKILIQERAAHEVKVAIKQYYQNKDITKDEYKEIVKKAVDKVCHSKSGEVDSAKVANLVKAYVDKYKHSRKKGPEDRL
ncbi:PREDICTED: protein SCAF11 [Nanorana parkeri]|uniref:protein SCAF11 n=1 Tax=Nanorana parkeri TaxID=125878 RepID=UPI000854C98A|nr:PREDICTED: protein SCAF11 [Nanorana parkeri]